LSAARGDRDVGVVDCRAEPVRRGDRGALFFQHIEHAGNLPARRSTHIFDASSHSTRS
jgi:hypothetical protein